MASLLGSSVQFECPACAEPLVVPVKQLGVDGAAVTVQLDLSPFRAHIAAEHRSQQTAADLEVMARGAQG